MLELYYMQSCPYCKKVVDYFDDNDIDYTLKDVYNSENYERLMKLGGEAQVPFLVDTDNLRHMYESDEIINYVSKLAN